MDGVDAPRTTSQQRQERAKRAAIDGAAARQEYEALAARTEDNTARLRALRLERDRLAAETASVVPEKPSKRSTARTIRRNVPLR